MMHRNAHKPFIAVVKNMADALALIGVSVSVVLYLVPTRIGISDCLKLVGTFGWSPKGNICV